MKVLKKYKHILIIPAYCTFYLIGFFFVEGRDVPIHYIHSVIDDWIPFCEYFIIPYVMWYAYILWTVLYFAVSVPDRREYARLAKVMITGMTLFLVISYLYPNGHHLRPSFASDSFFTWAVNLLYTIDTPTNVLPSIHVYNSVACCTALLKNERVRRNNALSYGIVILTVMITLATLFLKQHSVIDVMLALVLNIICYRLFYRSSPLPSRGEIRSIMLARRVGRTMGRDE